MINDSDFRRTCPHVDVPVLIGGACRTRYQIDKFMSKVNKKYKAESYYFDWLMMGGVAGVTNIFSRGFEISPTMIELHDGGGRFVPKDRLSRHAFLHDFGAGWWESDHAQAMSRLNQNMEQTIEKYRYLGRKTDALLRSNVDVALVYHGPAADAAWDNLLRALFDRYRKQVPIVNVIELETKATQVDGIYTTFIDDTHSPKRGRPIEWQGWDESWHSAFSSLRCFETDARSTL